MNVLLFRPPLESNLNDTLIEWGVRWLLKRAIGGQVRFELFHFEDPGYRDVPLPPHDLFVVCGSPWIWDQCTCSPKYDDLARALSGSLAPKIGLGLGACFPFGFDLQERLHVQRHLPNLDVALGPLCGIAVRDSFAQRACRLASVKCRLLCDPAVFAARHAGIKRRPRSECRDVLFFYAPQFGLSKGVLDSSFVERYIGLQVRYARQHSPRVVCIRPEEQELCRELHLEAELLRSPQEIANALAGARTLLAGRVHAAIFSVLLGQRAALLPVDTRYLAYTRCGGKVIWPEAVEAVSPSDLRRPRFIARLELWRWDRYLRACLRSAGLC